MKLIKNTYVGPLIMNRSLLAWANLIMAILMITLGFTSDIKWFSYIYFFMGGFLVNSWISDGYINTYQRLTEGLLQFTKRVLEDMKHQQEVFKLYSEAH